MLPARPLRVLLLPLLAACAPAQVLVDWDFSAVVQPGSNTPIGSPLLDAAASGATAGVTCSDLEGARAESGYAGLAWSTANLAVSELNLRYWDGDPSDLAGTAGDGVNDNYLTFTLTPTGAPLDVTRVSVSAWRNGPGAVDVYALEVVVDGGAPQPFGTAHFDGAQGDFGYDWFDFDDAVSATTSLEVRFRPVSAPGNAGTGNLHVNGLRVEGTVDTAPSGPNVLFLIADDLAPGALACYGNTQVLTPNIDALSARGTRFDNAYCQYPVCAASRASLLSGLYTARLAGAGSSYADLDAVLGAHPTLPEHFKLGGYTAARVSKLYHMRVPGDITSGAPGQDHAPSWNTTHNVQAPEWNTPGVSAHYTNENLIFNPNQHYGLGFGTAFYTVEASTSGAEQADVLAADRAYDLLGDLQGEPFFLAVGFVRPHVPLVAPASIFALYDAQSMNLAASVPGDLADIPSQGVFWNEPVRGPWTDDARRHVLRAYYASVTFMDEQVGRLLDRLVDLGLDDDTIVVFTSDHGYHLGEHTMWQKLSLHEESARVPLILAGPGIAAGTSASLTELVDLYPTLSDLAGLPIPAACQGHSLRSIVDGSGGDVRSAAYSAVADGHLLRTSEWAYMRYSQGGEELYDMRAAPVGDPLQFVNLAGVAAHAATLQSMRDLLDAKLLAVASDAGAPDCFGDGSGAACPCGATGGAGGGCANSFGAGAVLAGSGSPDTTSDSFRLTASGAPPGEFGYLLAGAPAPVQPVSAGLLCLAPQLRFTPQPIGADGTAEYAQLGTSMPSGLSLRYQFIYRDSAGACDRLNTSNAWTVTWN